MTAEERAALIDRLAPLITEERRKAADKDKRTPWYMVNIAHPVMGWLYNQYLAKLGEVSPPGGVYMPPTPHEAAAAPESSHSCCVGKYGNTTVQVMHNARHRPLLPACARRPPVRFPARLFPPGARPLRADCQAPRVRLGRRVFMVRVQHRHGPSNPCRPDQHRDAPPKNGG